MKILKVKAERVRVPGHTRYIYPPGYMPDKIMVVAYESMSEKGLAEVESRGDEYEFLIGVVSDKYAPGFLQTDSVEEITEKEAIEIGKNWVDRVIQVKDQNKVIQILAKFALEMSLTEEDISALDAENPAIGINRSLGFDERLKNYIEAILVEESKQG